MNFNSHSRLSGLHAFLSPSYYHWLNYDDQKLEARLTSHMAARRGTDLHDLAHRAVRLGVKLATSNQALGHYVRDAIGYKMTCEQPLYYSDNCFGHADTICFRRNKLRIHDLKTGIGSTSFKQLEIYAALFCLEYGASPMEIEIELRIYQGDEIRIHVPVPEAILSIMDKIIYSDRFVDQVKGDQW